MASEPLVHLGAQCGLGSLEEVADATVDWSLS
jgi:hypothetical protein